MAAAVAAAAAAALLYYLFDPVASRWAPQCLFHRLTGLDCPGCGSQRMLHALLHGDLAAAWRHNALAVCLLPLLPPMAWLELNRRRHPRLLRRICSPPALYTLIALIAGWFVARNFML